MMGARPAEVSNLENIDFVELLGLTHLCLLEQVLDLGLIKDDVGVGDWFLVYVGLLDQGQNVLPFLY